MNIVEHKRVLEHLAELIQQEEGCVARIYSDPARIEEQTKILEWTRKKKEEDFYVLVMGCFSSGKSSLINALIGEELLPTGFLPETAVIGELHYSEEKRITLYPKKGCWEGGDEPFKLEEATTAEIEKYVSLSSEDAINAMEETAMGTASENRINAKFEKMVIYWPLDMLKDGVVVVDSPGINDPNSNDFIVESYLPQADAVVYVMNSQQAYSDRDRKELTLINQTGRRDIVTGYTYYDIIRNQSKRPEDLKKTRSVLVSRIGKHTDLGPESVHFLDSLSGLAAKLSKDDEELRNSGFEGFEEYLARYLVEGKGRTQIKNMASTILLQAKALKRDAESLNTAAAQDKEEMARKANNALQQLSIVRSNSLNTGKLFRDHLEGYLPDVKRMIEDFSKKMPEQIDLEDFEPETELPDGAAKLWPFGKNGTQKRTEAIKRECTDELQRRMQAAYRKWAADELEPYIKNAVHDTAQMIRPELEQVAKDLESINSAATGLDIQKKGSNFWNIALGVVCTLLTHDPLDFYTTAYYGAAALGRTVALEAVGIGVLAALAVAGAPITLPMIYAITFGTNIVAIIMQNNTKKVEKIKKQAVKTFLESMASESGQEVSRKTVDSIYENICRYFEDACLTMQDALAQDIKNTEDSLEQIISESKLTGEKRQEQIKSRKQAIEELDTIYEETMKICQDYKLSNVLNNIG